MHFFDHNDGPTMTTKGAPRRLGSVSLFRNLTTKHRVVMAVTALMFARD
jgi:hypothetical protein